MAIEQEKLVYKAELDAKDATRQAQSYEERLKQVERRQRELAAAEKATAVESARLRKAQENLRQAEISGTQSKRQLALEAKIIRLEMSKQAEATRKLRDETANLRREEKALRTEQAAARRAEEQARRIAAKTEAAIARDVQTRERLSLRNASLADKERAGWSKMQSSGERIANLQKSIEELDRQLFELEGRSVGGRAVRNAGNALERGILGNSPFTKRGGRFFDAQGNQVSRTDVYNEAAGRGFGRMATGVPGLVSGTIGLATKGAATLGGAVAGVGAIGGGFERQRAALGTALGSDAAGAEAFDQVRKFAKETPFAVSEITEAVTALKVRGVAPTVEAAMEALRTYGDVAGAMGKDLKSVVEAVSDASIGDFERLKEAFNVTAHKAGDEVKLTFAGTTTTVKNDAKEIQAYLLNLGKTNFAGGMEKQSRTLLGAWSNLGDAIANFADEIYKNGLGDALKEVLQDITGNVDGAETLAETIGELLAGAVRDGYKWLKELIGPLDQLPAKLRSAWEVGEKFASIIGSLVSLGASLVQSFDSSTIAIGLFGVALTSTLGPLGLVVTAAMAAGAAIASMLDGSNTKLSELERTADRIRAKERQDEIERKEREIADIHAEMEADTRKRNTATALGDRLIAAELRKRGVSSLEELPEKERLALTRLRYGSEQGLRTGEQRAFGGGSFEERTAAFEASIAERETAADRSEFGRLSRISSKKRTPSQEKRLDELAKKLDIKKPTGGKPNLTAFEEDQKRRIDQAVNDAELRAGDEAILAGRGGDAASAAKTAGKETRARLKAAAARGEALPGQVDTAFARIVGYQDVVNAPPPPVMVIAPKFDVSVPVEIHGSFTGDPQMLGNLVVTHLEEVLETKVLPKAALELAPDWTR